MNKLQERSINSQLVAFEKNLIKQKDKENDEYDKNKIIAFLQKQNKLDLWNYLVPKHISEQFLWDKIIKLKYELKKQHKTNKDKDWNKIKIDELLFKDSYSKIFVCKKIKYQKQQKICIPWLMSLVWCLLQLVKINKEEIKEIIEEKRKELENNLKEQFDYEQNARKILEKEFWYDVVDEIDKLAKKEINPNFDFWNCVQVIIKKLFDQHKHFFSMKKDDLEYYLELFLCSRYDLDWNIIK